MLLFARPSSGGANHWHLLRLEMGIKELSWGKRSDSLPEWGGSFHHSLLSASRPLPQEGSGGGGSAGVSCLWPGWAHLIVCCFQRQGGELRSPLRERERGPYQFQLGEKTRKLQIKQLPLGSSAENGTLVHPRT